MLARSPQGCALFREIVHDMNAWPTLKLSGLFLGGDSVC